MIFSGLDEAALGPKLGPFCACLCRFSHPGTRDNFRNLYQLLSKSTASPDVKTENRILIGDSKKIYSPSKGTGDLEFGVIAFLHSAGISFPTSFPELIKVLAPSEDHQAMLDTPWFSEAADLRIPRSEILPVDERFRALMENLKESKLSVKKPGIRFIPAASFNCSLQRRNGKGGALQSILAPLMKLALNGESGEETLLTVDRQGGRRYYGEWLAELVPGSRLRAAEEGPVRSVYQVNNHQVEFLVKADAIRLEVALASMISKYLREMAMILFNRWWAERITRLKPTAGYPLDAARFIADLEAAGMIPVDRDTLIRRL